MVESVTDVPFISQWPLLVTFPVPINNSNVIVLLGHTYLFPFVIWGLWDSWTPLNHKRLLVPDPPRELLLLRPAVLPAEGSSLQGKRSQPTPFKFLWRLSCRSLTTGQSFLWAKPKVSRRQGPEEGGRKKVEGEEPTHPIGDWKAMWTWAGMLNTVYRGRVYIWEQKLISQKSWITLLSHL